MRRGGRGEARVGGEVGRLRGFGERKNTRDGVKKDESGVGWRSKEMGVRRSGGEEEKGRFKGRGNCFLRGD